MNKEQIEQAASEYIDDLRDREIDYTQIDYEETSYEAGRNRALLKFGEDIFMAGADWRINSVWHKPCDIAEPGKDCLVEHMDADGNICIRIDWRSEYEWVQACHYDKILRWAYVEDLITTKGGEK